MSDVKLPNFDNIGVVVEPQLQHQTVDGGLKQTLARLLGWNYLRQQFEFLKCTSDGVLLVSTEATKCELASHSVVTVETTSALVLAAHPARRSFTLMNNGSVPVYFQLGATALLASSMVLNAGISWSDDLYVGQVAAIVETGDCELRVLEHV